MEKSLDITSTLGTGVQQRASKHPCWKTCFGKHYRSDSANNLYFHHKIRTGAGELIWLSFEK